MRYTCPRWPFLKIGKAVAFQGGVFETEDPDTIALIERADGYGLHIVPVDQAPEPTEAAVEAPAVNTAPPVTLDQPAEERWAPRVRQGARGSRG